MRDNCLNCARKHLAQALILIIEARLGYPDHQWLAIGHICEAESELYVQWLGIALELREHRKAYEEDGGYDVPIMDFIRRLGDEKKILPSPGV